MALGYQNPFYLKQAQKKQQSLYDGKVLLEKHDLLVVHDYEETLQLAQESRDKMKQINKEIKPANYTKINHLSGIFVPQKALSHEELYFPNNSKMANVSKSFLIPNEDLLDDATPSVARKFLNEVKSTILTFQRVVKQRMTIETHNWASFAHQELHKIVRDEIFPIVNQVDARLQNFKIQFLKKAAKFIGDFKSLANEADASLAKHKVLELEIKRLLKAVVSQDIMIIVLNESVVDTLDLQTKLEHYNDMQQKIKRLQAQLGDLKGKSKDTSSVSDTQNPLSQKLENKNVELEFQVLNYARENAHRKATYKNLFDSIYVSRAQTKTIIASLQNELQSNMYKNAKLRTQLFKKVSDQKDNTLVTGENTKFAKQLIVENLSKVGMFRINPSKTSREEKHVPNTGKSSDTQCASNTLDPLSQNLEDENMSLESQVSEQKGVSKGTRTNTKFTNKSILGKSPSSSFKPKLYSVTPFPKSLVLPKVDKTNALSKPVTSNSAPFTRELKVVQTINVIALRIFRTNPSNTSRVDNVVPKKPIKTSARIKPITFSQPNVIHKQQANSDLNGFSSTKVNNIAKTRRTHHMSNSNTNRVPSKSKSSCLSNNIEKIEEIHRNSQIPKNQKHMSSKCNNITLAIRNTKSKIVCVMCKQCLVTIDHDVCVLNYVNDMNSPADNPSANVSIHENQKKYKANANKSKGLGSKGSLASSRPSEPRTCLRWIPTRRIFSMCGKLTASSNTKNKSEKSACDNASTYNPSKPSSKGFSNSASLIGRLSRLRKQHTSIYPIAVL
nr:hypothetical protein [Tanacetum cinerariifolium]